MTAPSNVIALVAVTLTLFACFKWVIPHLGMRGKYYFGMLTAWSIPYLIGQFAQEDKWGSAWVQYHLLDLAYGQWATLLGTTLYVVYKRVRHQEYSSATILRWTSIALLGAMSFGYLSEAWDTCWAWYKGGNFLMAVDMNDYICISIGIAITAMPLIYAGRFRLTRVQAG